MDESVEPYTKSLRTKLKSLAACYSTERDKKRIKNMLYSKENNHAGCVLAEGELRLEQLQKRWRKYVLLYKFLLLLTSLDLDSRILSP